MTLITPSARTDGPDPAVLDGVVRALASQGIVVTDVNTFFGGRGWSVTVHHAASGMTETEVRIAVWNTVTNYTAILGVPEPVDGVRVHLGA